MALLFGTEVKKSYIIASLQRTGSYFLCQALANTDIAGYPTEPYAPDNIVPFARRWGISEKFPFIDYIAESVKQGTSLNEVFGVKIHWNQVEWTRSMMQIGEHKDEKILDYMFPNALYIHLTRRDLRGQAISSYRAYHTNEWWRMRDVHNANIKAPDPPYDSEKIRYYETFFVGQQANWVRYFKKRNLTPLHVDYEDLIKNWRKETTRCLEFLGLDPKVSKESSPPTMERQADALTRAWRKRLNEEDVKRGQKNVWKA